jgi:O-methyltransferase
MSDDEGVTITIDPNAAYADLLYERYATLLARSLTGELREDPPIDPWHGVVVDAEGRIVKVTGAIAGTYTIHPGKYDANVRRIGADWPEHAETMIGALRMANLKLLVETIIYQEIPGDLIETGVWRGGACIFMRGLLTALVDPGRKVFVCDSFEGLPKGECAEDKYDAHHGFSPLAVSLDAVKRNFERYGLLDDRVVFVKGWFKDTLSLIESKQFALIRLDGDMYGSTIDALTTLYPRLSIGGFCIIDDFNLPPVQLALRDYFGARFGKFEIIAIDRCGVFWRKEQHHGI